MDGLEEGSMVTWPSPKTFAGYVTLVDLVSRSCSPQCLGVEERGAKLKSLLRCCVHIGVTSRGKTDPGLRASAHGTELIPPHLLA